MKELLPPRLGIYHKVSLTNVKLWQPCVEEDAMDWVGGIDNVGDGIEPYPVKALPYQQPFIGRIYIIVQPDGSIWREGSLYLLERVTELGTKASTASNIAGDLANFMNEMLAGNRNYLDFSGPSFMRPTYYYKSTLKTAITKGLIKRKTANRKINSMIGLYRWKTECRSFKPQEEMWKSKIKNTYYTDRHGFSQVKPIICTDLTFKITADISSGNYIEDGGKLYPISRENQRILIETLIRLENPEMLLIYVVALTTGMRIQSILTLRSHCIRQDVGGEYDENRFALYGIAIGQGTLVESKNQTPQTVLMPAWVHHKLTIYLNSERYKGRTMKSAVDLTQNQYLFLTRTGKPYYVAEEDQELFGFTNEKGSAIRKFATYIKNEMKYLTKGFEFRFHDLRATFGMNLIEDNMKKDKEAKLNQLELLDLVKNRLNHSSIEVTMRYLRFRESQSLIADAQSDFEAHLEGVITTEMIRHEEIRTSET